MSRKVWIILGIVSVLVVSLISYDLTQYDDRNQRAILIGKVILTNSVGDHVVINNLELWL